MSQFTVRVELHQAARSDCQRLPAAMKPHRMKSEVSNRE